jgi:transposase
MRAYSYDLRQRILHAVDQGKPRAEIIKTFEVSQTTIKRYLKLRRETDDVKPKLKAFLRQVGTRTPETLQEAIGQALHTITANDAHGWFRHCGYLP